MKPIKLFLAAILFSVTLTIVLINPTQAADYHITCDADGCTSPGVAIFNQTNLAPGDSITKTIEVKNLYNETLNLDMNASKNQGTDDSFLDVVDVTVIGLGGRTRYSGSLNGFLQASLIDLGSLNDQGLEQVTITFTLQDVGNEFQGKKANFDINVNIDVQASGPSVGGTGDGAASSPSPSPTTSLVAGAFTFSPPSPGSAILGEATPSSLTQSDKALGAWSFNWWWPLLAQLILSVIYYFFNRQSTKTLFYLALFPLFLVFLSQYIHSRLGCPNDSPTCPWYWLFNLAIFSSTTFGFHRFRQ